MGRKKVNKGRRRKDTEEARKGGAGEKGRKRRRTNRALMHK
jgi:hypothetical protein